MKNYNKPALSINDQINLLQSRGLLIKDINYAKSVLEKLNYYNFSGYTYIFEDKSNKRTHNFSNKTTFEEVFEVFKYDIQIRQLLFSCISYVEIYMRNIIARSFLDVYNNDPFANYNLVNYYNVNSEIKKEVLRSKEIFINHYKKEYLDYPKIPIWISVEIMSLGTLSKFYSSSDKKLQTLITNNMNLYHYKYLKSWLFAITEMRNRSVHHSRILCRQLLNPPIIPKNVILNSNYNWNLLLNSYLFNFIVTLEYIVKVSNIYTELTLPIINNLYDMIKHISENKILKNKPLISDIGIPNNWNGGLFFI
ncbi:Abi family protein [uncultured Brachyspira sp.]|uniref:Abi family protein n=1 Tax=uncultured Brachyspira sp. TaxID=221953 RepID=UPI002618C51B|nr:Abi family protein [uncultured Brachyspira sp.]